MEDVADDQVQDIPEENRKASAAYGEFLQFLELGCSGSPIQGYPTVIIILSTIPSDVRLRFISNSASLTIPIRFFSLRPKNPSHIFSLLSGLLSMVAP